jgi:hypothetical protein
MSALFLHSDKVTYSRVIPVQRSILPYYSCEKVSGTVKAILSCETWRDSPITEASSVPRKRKYEVGGNKQEMQMV